MDNRYYFDIKDLSENCVTINGQEFIHFSKVRRGKVGDEINAFCGDGNDYSLKVKNINKNNAECEVIDKKINPSVIRPDITVCLASIKTDALDEALDNLTQLNIKNIVIFESEFTNIKYTQEKVSKLENHFIQSCKQCERADLPKVRLVKFNEMLNIIKEKDLTIFAYENAEENFLTTDLVNYNRKSIAVVVGGEGGFSKEEVDELSSFSKRVSLGKTILRAPVAVTALCSAVLANMGEWHR